MTILVTAIGSFSADCVISSLKREGHRVIGCDIYPSEWHPISKDCDRVYQVPFATDERNYVDNLLEIGSEEEVDLLFPLTDLEIDVLNKYREEFTEANIQLCLQSAECLEIARNKYRMVTLFANDEVVKVPQTVAASNYNSQMSFPAIAKPINGRSSEGLCKLYSIEDISIIKDKENYIIQEMLPGNVYTVDYVRDIWGNDFAVPREELLRTKNGAGTTVRIVNNTILQRMVSYIGDRIGIVGCVNMEFIYSEGKFYLIDINPRFSAGVAFSHIAGYNMVVNHLNCMVGKQIDRPVDIIEQIVAKRYIEKVL